MTGLIQLIRVGNYIRLNALTPVAIHIMEKNYQNGVLQQDKAMPQTASLTKGLLRGNNIALIVP